MKTPSAASTAVSPLETMNLKCLVLAAICWLAALTSQASAETTLLLVGDSTVAKQSTTPGSGPARGWGQVLSEFLVPDVVIQNAAANGRSSKSFIDEGKWTEALKCQPDYVFILWGTNDNNADPARHTDPATTFKEYLRRYISDSIAAGAKPVLITPSAIRIFKPNGTIKNSLAPYAEAMKEVGQEKGVPVIDLNAASLALFEELGPDGVVKLAATSADTNHYNEEGARAVAKIIVDALPAAVPDMEPLIAGR